MGSSGNGPVCPCLDEGTIEQFVEVWDLSTENFLVDSETGSLSFRTNIEKNGIGSELAIEVSIAGFDSDWHWVRYSITRGPLAVYGFPSGTATTEFARIAGVSEAIEGDCGEVASG